jgi:3-oxoacyl-[acyl-carrier protein] reductase
MTMEENSVSLKGRTAFVTGAGGGVGEGLALALAKAGANVVVAARRLETGEPVVARIRDNGGEAVCIRTDVADEGSVLAAIEQTASVYGGLDILVHNAVSARATDRTPIAEAPEDLFDDVVATSSRATFWCVKAALPHLQRGRGRVILLLAHGGVRGHGSLSVYGVAKGMQRGILKALTWELGERGITVNGIVPVALTDGMARDFERRPGEYERQAARAALGYIGKPEADVGGAAVFFASDAARYITGQTLFVDGGVYML